MKRLNILLSLILFLCFTPMSVSAVEVFMAPGTSFETLNNYQSFRARKIIVPNFGFVSADFDWNRQYNAWVFNGEYVVEDPVSPTIELWKNYWTSNTPVNESLTVWVTGVDLTGVSFVSPNGITYSDFVFNYSVMGFDDYSFEKKNLPIGQTEFTDGEYVFTFTFATGPPLQKSYYISGVYPLFTDITYPLDGTTGVPVTFTATWSAAGAGFYDFIIRDELGYEVYNTVITNTTDTDLTHTIPLGILSPLSVYRLTIEALTPEINGGHKGVKKTVTFTTA